MGYTIDVYRKDIYAEKNFFRYALFVSFFPQLVAGPIERSKNLLKQLAVPGKLKFDNFREGFLLMLWGYFLKVVLADRIAIFVDTVYGENWKNYDGIYFIVATVLFAIQIYCDFYGYSVIAVGTAKILDISLMDNFNAPYLSQTTSEFWRRWHISLSSWFRDYLYIPLGGNRKGRLRKYLNILITFTASGLWHGASWTYLVWGLLNGIYQVTGDILKPVRKYAAKILGIHPGMLGSKIIGAIGTFICIDISWIFFRSSGIAMALHVIKQILVTKQPWVLFDGSLYKCGIDQKNFTLMLICIAILFGADILRYKKVTVSKIILRQDWWFQVIVYPVIVLGILLFGIWGGTFDASGFICFQF